MAMRLKVGGRMLTSGFGSALSEMSKRGLADLQQRITVTGNAEGKRFADELLAKAIKKAPMGSFTGAQGIGENRKSFSNAERNMAKTVSANLISYKGKGLRIQMRGAKGQFTSQRKVYNKQVAGRSYSFVDHSPGALRASGRVEEGGTKNNPRWIVSFDTRRTDPYSMMHNFNYAIKQHNDTRLKHKVGESGFLVKALLETKSSYFAELSSALKRELKKGSFWR